MKFFFLSLRIFILLYLGYLLIFLLSDDYSPAQAWYSPPFMLLILDWINLFIHEAGHLFFSPFGFLLNLLGGSILQILIPFTAVIVWYNRDRLNTHYFIFWMGESAINVSTYIADAPYRRLRLISSGALHDWYTILNRLSLLEYADTIGMVVYICGILIIAGSIAAGIFSVVYQFRFWTEPPIPE